MKPVEFFKCLADSTRLQCLLLIEQQQELCVCELEVAITESQPKISRHLAQLRRCGLLNDRRQGQWVFYSINPELPDWCTAILRETTQANQSFIQVGLDNLGGMGSRPARKAGCC